MNQSYARLREHEDEGQLRIVLVGKTGVGKSSSGNTILGRTQVFYSTADPTGVTKVSVKERAYFDEHTLDVVDTPGLFDPNKNKEELVEVIVTCIGLAAPGPHAFLIVLTLGKFTDEEQQSVKIIQETFGEESSRYSMVLFTHGDDLEANQVCIEQFIAKSPNLHTLINECGGGYHVFNNRDTKDPSQVRELLKKINTMVQRNGGSYYTSGMLQEAEADIVAKKKKLMSEDPNMSPEEARKRAEHAFIKGALTTAAAMFGAAVGAGVEMKVGAVVGGLVAGPIGAAVGAAAGVAVAAAVVAVKKLKKKSDELKKKSEEVANLKSGK